jgi:hypothetical protein
VGSSAIVIDHTTVDASVIPVAYLDKARRFDVVFQHKSVGINITDGLKALASGDATRYKVNIVGYPYWWSDDSGSHDGVPPTASWYTTHDGIASWGNGTNSQAATKTEAFDDLMRSGYGEVVQVALMKFCFNEVWSGTGQQTWDLYRPVMTGLIRDYPNVTFIWMTMPMAFADKADDGNDYGRPTYDFNNLVRAHVAQNGGYLFDIADIERYGRDGKTCSDSKGYPAICSDWAVSSSDVHLSEAGSARAANAWWYLMARVAGWAP